MTTPTTTTNTAPLVVNVSENTGAALMKDSISQSTALAVQDVANYLRQAETVSAAAIAVCTEIMVSNPAEVAKYSEVVKHVNANLVDTSKAFESVTKNLASAFALLK